MNDPQLLISAYFFDELTAAQMAELEAWVDASDDNARRFARQSLMYHTIGAEFTRHDIAQLAFDSQADEASAGLDDSDVLQLSEVSTWTFTDREDADPTRPCRINRNSLAYGLIGVTAIAASIILLLLAFVRQPTHSSGLEPVAVTCELVTSTGRVPVAFGTPIHSGDQVLHLDLDNRHRVVVNHNTILTVAADSGSDVTDVRWSVRMQAGELYAKVSPGSHFHIDTPNSLTKVTGTKFNVSTSPGETELVLLEGSVLFASKTQPANEISVRTGERSRVIGTAPPTTPDIVDAIAAVAWARDDTASARSGGRAGDASRVALPNFDALAGIAAQTVDLKNIDYIQWREDHRAWFAEQFPWAMKLEAALADDLQSGADYLDILIISGDIWQFHVPDQMGQPIPIYHSDSIERIAAWHQLRRDALFETAGVEKLTTPSFIHDANTFASALETWGRSFVAAGSHDANVQSRALITFEVAKYIETTHMAIYLWIREHPAKANRLLASSLYRDYLASSVATDSEMAINDVLQQLDHRIGAARECKWSALKMIADPSTSCRADMQKRILQTTVPPQE